MAVLSAKSHFPMVSGVNPDPMEGIPQVDFRKILWRALARVILFPALGRNLPYLPDGLGRSSSSR